MCNQEALALAPRRALQRKFALVLNSARKSHPVAEGWEKLVARAAHRSGTRESALTFRHSATPSHWRRSARRTSRLQVTHLDPQPPAETVSLRIFLSGYFFLKWGRGLVNEKRLIFFAERVTKQHTCDSLICVSAEPNPHGLSSFSLYRLGRNVLEQDWCLIDVIHHVDTKLAHTLLELGRERCCLRADSSRRNLSLASSHAEGELLPTEKRLPPHPRSGKRCSRDANLAGNLRLAGQHQKTRLELLTSDIR